MTLDASDPIIPRWRTVFCVRLAREIQVKRISVADVGLPVHEMWLRLVRDGDGSPLLPAGVGGGEVDPTLVEEVCKLAMSVPTSAGA